MDDKDTIVSGFETVATKKSFNNFLIFLIGQFISLLGSSIASFTIIFWITVETNSALFLGLAGFLGFGSTMAVIPFAGVLVDRWSRKKLIILVDGLEAISTVGIIFLFVSGNINIWWILLLLTLRGVFQGFHDPAIQAIIPILVPQDKLKTVNSFHYISSGFTNLVGPLIGAGMIGLFGVENIGNILWIDAITFIIALLPIIFISIPSISKTDNENQGDFLVEFKEGVNYITKTDGLLSLLVAFTTANFCGIPIFTLLPLIIISPLYLNENEGLLAIAMFIQALGSILGSVYISKTKIFKNNALGVFVGLFALYVANIVIGVGVIVNSLIAIFVGLFFTGYMIPVANISSQTIWQTSVPLELQGRVYGVRRFIAQALGPFSMIFAGYFGEVIGIAEVILGSSIIGLTLLIYLWFYTKLPNVERILNEQLSGND